MRTSPGYTVVIPTFNRAGTIQTAVRSGLDQGLVEVVVVDDGSTDDTVDVLEAIDDARLRVLARPHEGRCAARNTGAHEASCAWLVFLDSDDVLLPGALATFDAARTPDASLVVAPTRRVSPDGAASFGAVFWAEGAPLPWGLQAGGFAIHRSLFADLGGYCTELDHSEHTEMALRMRRLTPTPTVASASRPTVEVHERATRYDAAVQYRSATHLLEHVAEELEMDRRARALQLGVAGEAARRLGNRSEAIRYLTQAFRTMPGFRPGVRLVRALGTTSRSRS